MCSIFGGNYCLPISGAWFDHSLDQMIRRAHTRGRDGRGFVFTDDLGGMQGFHSVERSSGIEWPYRSLFLQESSGCIIGNTRAEPTTEFVETKSPDDQQPYRLDGWTVVHNGTIANDKALRSHRLPTTIDSAAIVEDLARGSLEFDGFADLYDTFLDTISRLQGSFAILAMHERYPGFIFAACNYRPIWYSKGEGELYIASARDALPTHGPVPVMLPPYSACYFTPTQDMRGEVSLRPAELTARKSLVICSGGLDSVVAATVAKAEGDEVGLIHFQYGSRAEGPEVEAVREVAKRLEVPLTLFPLNIYDPADSPLLRSDSAIAGGEEGAEFAHEWVPARNLVMLSVATAFAEAKGYNNIILGNNLEEAGAYPDNEPEFIARFADLLPFAVGDGKQVTVGMPVGNMMKHEIVALGHHLGAPLDATWSCYRAGEKHCGTCGPCYMRRTAFRINNLPEVIQYEDQN